ncbi:MAG: hypothetical protein V1903_02430 [Bacteroidota bacterium]
MKRVSIFAVVVVMLILTPAATGQNLCKVLMPSISDNYTGSCKQGLADGMGEASGVDRYIGEFKKGLPDGDGTYTWQTGEIYKGGWKKGLREGNGTLLFNTEGRDSTLAGIWRDDKYIGKENVSPYVIGYRSNVGRVTCMKAGDERSYIKYKFSRSGEASSFIAITDLMMQGSSGTENISTNFTGYEDITFPFEGKVQFTAPSTLTPTVTLNCEVRLKLNEPGSWIVTIYY